MRYVMILLAGILFSCGTFRNFANPGEAYTGTANEPGTQINPYPLSDYYEEYPKSVKDNAIRMDDGYAENELFWEEDSLIYSDVKPDPGDIIIKSEDSVEIIEE